MTATYGTCIYWSSMNIPDPYLLNGYSDAHHPPMTNVAYYRKLRRLSQEQLAEKVGVKQPHISRIEKGDDGPPLRLFKDIAMALGVSLSDLFSDEMTAAEVMILEAYRSGSDEARRLLHALALDAKSRMPPSDQ